MRDPQEEKAREQRLQRIWMNRFRNEKYKKARPYQTCPEYINAENEKRNARELLREVGFRAAFRREHPVAK